MQWGWGNGMTGKSAHRPNGHMGWLGSLAGAGILGLLVSGAAVLAQDNTEQQGTAAQRIACTPDVFRLCAQEIPNADRIVACLKQEMAYLSPACRAVFAWTPARLTANERLRRRHHLTAEDRAERRHLRHARESQREQESEQQ